MKLIEIENAVSAHLGYRVVANLKGGKVNLTADGGSIGPIQISPNATEDDLMAILPMVAESFTQAAAERVLRGGANGRKEPLMSRDDFVSLEAGDTIEWVTKKQNYHREVVRGCGGDSMRGYLKLKSFDGYSEASYSYSNIKNKARLLAKGGIEPKKISLVLRSLAYSANCEGEDEVYARMIEAADYIDHLEAELQEGRKA